MESIISLHNISKSYKVLGGKLQVLHNVSFDMESGEILGLIGESGSGKSTLARIAAGIENPDSGVVLYRGRKKRRFDGSIQIVYQNNVNSFNPKLRMRDSLIEPLTAKGTKKIAAIEQITDAVRMCGLPEDILNRYPRELSGGQCQRAAIARAVVALPQLVICDEITSALDEKTSTQMTDLLLKVRQFYKVNYLMISHDMSVIDKMCTHVLVLRGGEIQKKKCKQSKLEL